MYYIVGLGNPGTEYDGTRHNVGWEVLSYVIETDGLPGLVDSSAYAGRISEGVLGGQEVSLLFPSTFMNKSGSAVLKLVPKDAIEKLVVVHDEVDLPMGEVKVSVGRGAGGNNGVASIISSLGSKEFIRIRVGIAPVGFFTGKPHRPAGGAAMTRHVLGKFTRREATKINEAKEKVRQVLHTIVADGVEAAMNQCN